MGQTVLPVIKLFWGTFEHQKIYEFLVEIFTRSWKKQYMRSLKGQKGSNCIASWSKVSRNIEGNSTTNHICFL